jgi:predicted anti-sigma-YlaC factor YlaD
MGAVLAAECERARTWASLALDGELSQVESARLSAHVGRCARCAEFARDVDAVTQELRAMPSVRPRAQCTPVRRRNSGARVLQLSAAVVVVASAAALGSMAGSLTSRPAARAAATSHSAEAIRFATAVEYQQHLRRVRTAFGARFTGV